MHTDLSVVTYEGSPYHKRYPADWGPPKWDARSDKTECPPEVPPGEAAEILLRDIRESIDAERCSLMQEQGGWPRYVWGRSRFPSLDREVCWEARVNNVAVPSYKAYPVEPHRHSQMMPPEVREYLWPDL
jgi:hypothetical protein